MKLMLLGAFAAALITMTSVPDANAAVCARGVHRAGCAGPRGAVVVHRPMYHRHCHWHRGIKICR